MRTSNSFALSAAALVALAGLAHAAPPVLDFNVEDDPSYHAFRDAIKASEYVRYDYVTDRRPRVVGTAAALLVYATRNPLATEAQLGAFVAAFDAALAGYSDGDPDLRRSSELLPALRFSGPFDSVPELAGTDTTVGEEVMELLGLSVPPPDNFESMQRRMVKFDQARVRGLANSKEWSTVLVIGFSGQDLSGAAHPHLASVFRAYIESQGFEPVPDGVDDDRFADVDAALVASLPADYASYTTLLSQSVATSTAWAAISSASADVADATSDRLAELAAELDNEPSLVEGVANANDPDTMTQLLAEYRARIDEVAAPRTVFAVNSLLLIQSEDESARSVGRQARDFSSIQLETNNTMAGVAAGVQYASGVATLFVGIASGSPADAISGLTDSVLGGMALVDHFGGVSPPSVEEQIFEQIVEMRQQIEDMRVEMHERFDRIEIQLNVINQTMAQGFNALGDQIGDLSDDVDEIARDITIVRASLERIEDALWGMAEDVLLLDLTILANDLLDYRDDAGTDLPYAQSSPNFVSGASSFFSWATTIARNTTFAGAQTSTLTVENAHDRLNGSSIGRNINDLRVFPVRLGLPALGSSRIPAPAPWTQAASAYAQLAHESPWYFAYMYQQQSAGGGSSADLDTIIAAGQSLASAAAAGRNADLFSALFDGYDDALQDVSTAINAVRQSVLTQEIFQFAPCDQFDPWAGTVQDIAACRPQFTTLNGTQGLQDLYLPSGIGSNCWRIYGQRSIPQITSLLAYAAARRSGAAHQNFDLHRVIVDANGTHRANDFRIRFRYTADADYDGSHPEFIRQTNRTVVMFLTNFGSPVQIGSDNSARDLFDEDVVFWNNLRPTLLDGTHLLGRTIQVFNGNNDRIDIFFAQDSIVDSTTYPATPFVISELHRLQDEIWTAAASDPVVNLVSTLLPGYESLIEAYATFSLPGLMEQSTVARAALRASPATGELSLSFTQPVNELLLSFVGDGDNDRFIDITDAMAPRAAIARNEILEAVNTPGGGHSYIDWTLAELRDLRNRVYRLAIDDTYTAPGGETLVVAPAAGLLANDVAQQYRTAMVDASFVNDPMYVPPAHGMLSLNSDGSFTYHPDSGYTGTDTFTYRTLAGVGPGGTGPFVNSDPARVVIIIEGAECGADFNDDGVVNSQDFFNFLTAFFDEDPAADVNNDAVINSQDYFDFLTMFFKGC